ANSTVKVYDGAALRGSGAVGCGRAGSYGTTGTLANGAHSFTATATDAAGNSSAASAALAVTVDSVAPAVPSIAAFSPDTGVLGRSEGRPAAQTLTGRAEADRTTKADDGATAPG